MSQRPPADAPAIPASLHSALRYLAGRRLTTATFLLAAGFQPLLFMSGQLLQVGRPFLALWMDSEEIDGWASLLSHPGAERELSALLGPTLPLPSITTPPKDSDPIDTDAPISPSERAAPAVSSLAPADESRPL